MDSESLLSLMTSLLPLPLGEDDSLEEDSFFPRLPFFLEDFFLSFLLDFFFSSFLLRLDSNFAKRFFSSSFS
jgi:hypothetical protein